jgi:hypothetical protein
VIRIALAVCKIVEEKALREIDTENFDMLRELRDSNKYVIDPKEFMSVINKLCKTSLSLDLVRATYG